MDTTYLSHSYDPLSDGSSELFNAMRVAIAEKPEQFQRAILLEFEQPEAQAAIRQEIDNLRDTVDLLQRNFVSVRAKLRRFDIEGLYRLENEKTGQKVAIEKLEPLWENYHDQFRKLMLDSQRMATEVTHSANEYRTDIIDAIRDPTNSNQEKVNRVEEFVQYLSAHELKSDDIASGFDSLNREITNFCKKIKGAVHDAHVSNHLEIDIIESKIAQISARLEKWGKVATASTSILTAVGSHGLGYAGGALSSGIVITPVGWVCIIAAAVVTVGAGVGLYLSGAKTKKLNSELHDLRMSRDKLLEEEKSIKALRIIFEMAEGEINGICSRLSVMSRVWSLLKHDISRLHLDLVEGKDITSKLEFDSALSLSEKLYEQLEISFAQYAAQLR